MSKLSDDSWKEKASYHGCYFLRCDYLVLLLEKSVTDLWYDFGFHEWALIKVYGVVTAMWKRELSQQSVKHDIFHCVTKQN